MKMKHWVALAVGAMALLGVLVQQGVIPWGRGSSSGYISGVVSDSVTQTPMAGVVVQLQTSEAKPLGQDTTDSEGKFNLVIPDHPAGVRVHAEVEGYRPYDQKLPAQEAQNDIHLVRLPMVIGISDGTPLGEGLRIVSSRLGITAIPSTSCSAKARMAPVNGTELRGDSRVPELFLKSLINSVKDSRLRYDVMKIEEGRYEIRCL